MKKHEYCEVKNIEYEASDTIEKQGKRDDIEKYLKKGYYVKEERNGYWVLVRPSRVVVTLKSSIGTQNIYMKQEILDYYCKQRISEKQVEKFAKDIDSKKIVVCLDEKDNYLIIDAS